MMKLLVSTLVYSLKLLAYPNKVLIKNLYLIETSLWVSEILNQNEILSVFFVEKRHYDKLNNRIWSATGVKLERRNNIHKDVSTTEFPLKERRLVVVQLLQKWPFLSFL